MLLNVQMSLVVACTFIPSLSMTGRHYPADIRGVEKIRANSCKALILLEMVLESIHTDLAPASGSHVLV